MRKFWHSLPLLAKRAILMTAITTAGLAASVALVTADTGQSHTETCTVQSYKFSESATQHSARTVSVNTSCGEFITLVQGEDLMVGREYVLTLRPHLLDGDVVVAASPAR